MPSRGKPSIRNRPSRPVVADEPGLGSVQARQDGRGLLRMPLGPVDAGNPNGCLPSRLTSSIQASSLPSGGDWTYLTLTVAPATGRPSRSRIRPSTGDRGRGFVWSDCGAAIARRGRRVRAAATGRVGSVRSGRRRAAGGCRRPYASAVTAVPEGQQDDRRRPRTGPGPPARGRRDECRDRARRVRRPRRGGSSRPGFPEDRAGPRAGRRG